MQDRLVKEFALAGDLPTWGKVILTCQSSSLTSAGPFQSRPAASITAHRPVAVPENLAYILTWQEPRTLSKNLILQFKKVVYQIQTEHPIYAMRNAQVTVCEDSTGQVTILYKGKPLGFTIFHKQEHQADIVETKDVDRALQNQRKAHKPAPDHPWRKFPFPGRNPPPDSP